MAKYALPNGRTFKSQEELSAYCEGFMDGGRKATDYAQSHLNEGVAFAVAADVKAVDKNKVSLQDEEATSSVLQGLLREVDPMRIIDGLELVDEHKNINEENPF